MKNELATAAPLPLADMTVPQLGEAFAKLDDARARYERLSGICGTLQGLVLLEVKRKVGHGAYGKWLEDHFPKSHKTACQFTRAAEHFIYRLQTRNTPESKIYPRVKFEATQLLLGDLASNLAAIESAKLDMSHPVVEAVATYVGERSFRQLMLDLGTLGSGGDRRKIDPATGERINHTRAPLDIQLEARRRCAFDHCKAVCLGLAQLLEERPLGWDLLDADLKQALRETVRDYAAVLKDLKK